VSKLDEQETAIETLQREIAGYLATEQQQRQTLEDFLLGIELP
jgi:hypothetical protein